MDRNEIAYKIMNGVSCSDFKPLANIINDRTKGMYVILRLLTKANNEVTAGDIANSLNVSTARVAVALNTLEKKKYIVKYKSSKDARKTIVEITSHGKEALKERENKIVNFITKFLNKLTDNEIFQLLNIISKGINRTI